MNHLVKILTDEYGEKEDSPKWCLSVFNTGNMAFCSGQFYGFGESKVEYEIKQVKRGGITCERCISKIKDIKSVKL